MNCCAACFEDKALKDKIDFLSSKSGQCDYCGKNSLPLVEPHVLRDDFSTIIGIYDKDENGKFLADLLKEDWGLFPSLDGAQARVLLGDVLGDPNIFQTKFSPSPDSVTDSLGRWAAFRDELMHQNRFFPANPIDLEKLRKWLTGLIADPGEIPITWHRARLSDGKTKFKSKEMGAPPPSLSSHGRANPAGIPYLYLASDKVTAVSEIRPHTGETTCVASVRIEPGISAVDLQDPRKLISPFRFDEEDLPALRGDITLLERLGNELTIPVKPQSAAILYTPTQYLCEFIKSCGFDGVLYRSSVSENGVNLALFDPEKATVTRVTEHQVSKVSVALTKKTAQQ